MAEFFTKSELTRSDTARILKIDNTPTPEASAALDALMWNALDPIRRMWGKPIIVNSGYRCPKLNAAIGGSATSQHMKGEAADITAGDPTKNKELFDMIAQSAIPFDQLIDEKNYRWIHVSYRPNGRRNILHL
ncbi:D-Ala-D-Ala carboxypeptidase family metallohydrolase [Alistipes putredinis]|uniref:D-Ala-D-Ala carboxypeptidase family metallohydrolase n=1 Tax=Alistipes putredinis TaxID=28117 RepID=UPI003A86198E